MNYLIDTHIYLWTLFEPEKIPKKTKSYLLDPESIKHISIISFWEVSLKFNLGKIDLKGVLPDALPKIAKNDGFGILDMDVETVSSFYQLPKIGNNDPFDRMLIWQAIQKNMILISKDTSFTKYQPHGLKIVW